MLISDAGEGYDTMGLGHTFTVGVLLTLGDTVELRDGAGGLPG